MRLRGPRTSAAHQLPRSDRRGPLPRACPRQVQQRARPATSSNPVHRLGPPTLQHRPTALTSGHLMLTITPSSGPSGRDPLALSERQAVLPRALWLPSLGMEPLDPRAPAARPAARRAHKGRQPPHVPPHWTDAPQQTELRLRSRRAWRARLPRACRVRALPVLRRARFGESRRFRVAVVPPQRPERPPRVDRVGRGRSDAPLS